MRCQQGTDESQLGLERPLTFHGDPIPHPGVVREAFGSPENPGLSEIWDEARSQTISTSSCGKAPLSTDFTSSLCLFHELREARRLAQGHTANWGQRELESKPPRAVLVPSHRNSTLPSALLTPPEGRGRAFVQPDSLWARCATHTIPLILPPPRDGAALNPPTPISKTRTVRPGAVPGSPVCHL